MKKILILTSIGGGGQVAVNKFLNQALKTDYVISSTLYFSHVISIVDPVWLITFGNYTSENVYNYVQKKRLFRFIQACYHISRYYFAFLAPILTKKTSAYLKKEKPDLVISIIPIVNDIIAQSCKELSIPFLIIPPDFDVSFYTKDIQKANSKDIFIALPFDTAMSRKSMEPTNIPSQNVFSLKYPLRHDFYEKKDVVALKKEYQIIDDRPVLLLMMGAQGNEGSYIFAQELTKLKVPAHLLICIGKNKHIKQQLETLTFPATITPHIIGYTERISDLMAIADIMISKTGAISVVEALHSNLPIVADQTEYVLSWELFHQLFLEAHKCGLILKKRGDLAPLIGGLLYNKQLIKDLKENIAKIKASKEGLSIEEVIETIFSRDPT